MDQRPTSFGELIVRVAPPIHGDIYHAPAVVATARPLIGELSGQQTNSSWVICHSISDQGMRLIHDGRITAERLNVRIDAPSGERLSIVVQVMSTRKQGELFETTVEFLRQVARVSVTDNTVES